MVDAPLTHHPHPLTGELFASPVPPGTGWPEDPARPDTPVARTASHVGLAPAANGGNRTGRVFTGDSSGDWLFASLHRVGLAAQTTSTHAGDGQRLIGARMVAAVRCAPPANMPTTAERDTCAPWLRAEIATVLEVPRPRPKFGHAAEVEIGPLSLLGCYHPSQQNTFTGRLTPDMLDAVFLRAKELAALRD